MFMVVGGVGIAMQVVALLMNASTGIELPPAATPTFQMLQGGAGFVFSIIGIIVGVVILLGAMKMMKLQSYGFAMVANLKVGGCRLRHAACARL